MIIDILMALWNSNWREKILPVTAAFLVVGVSMLLFFVLMGLPAFSQHSGASNYAYQQRGFAQHVSMTMTVSTTPSVDVTQTATAVATPTPADASVALGPTPAPVAAASTPATDSPVDAPMPVQMPGIASDSGTTPAIYPETGAAYQAPSFAGASVSATPRRAAPTPAGSTPPPVPVASSTPVPTASATPIATAPVPTATSVATPTPLPTTPAVPTPGPTIGITPVPMPTSTQAAPPTVVAPTPISAPTPAPPTTPAVPTSTPTYPTPVATTTIYVAPANQ